MDPQHCSVRLSDGREFGPAPMEMIVQWAREGRVPHDAMLISPDAPPRPVMSEPSLASIVGPMRVQAPPTVSTGIPTGGDDAVSVIIPYKNPHALIGYYISIGSLIPLVGLIAGPVAIVLGVIGIRKRRQNPQMHGLAHAWVAIVMGSIGTLIGLGCVLTIIIAILDSGNRR